MNRKLTAEQVKETVEKHWHDLPADYGMLEATALPEYSYDWHAIADELNAELGDDDYERRMDELLCRLTNGKWSKSRSYSVDFMVSCVDETYEDATLGGGECENVSDKSQYFQCSECRSRGIIRKVFDNGTRFSFCPDCGAKVREAVKR